MTMYDIVALETTGPDAFGFLQGQLTNDLRRLESEPEILAAWCNPKGRVDWFGTLRRVDGGYRLSVPADSAAGMVERLKMFRFRARVEFDVDDDAQSVDPAVLIENGFPYIGPEQAGEFTPHMLNLDLLDAISFDKGCYTGQEIVARTHYKGATKRRTLRFGCGVPPCVGDKITSGGRDVGQVLNVADEELLAVVPLDKADEALTVGGAALVRKPLPFLP